MRDASVLSIEEVRRLASDAMVNKSIEENVLIYGLFSYFVLKGLKNCSTFDMSITDISRYFGVTLGKTGFRLVEKLESLQAVYGVLTDSHQVFPLVIVGQTGTKFRVSSQYMHHIWKAMLTASENPNTPYYFTGLAHANLVAERNKVAALIVIELVRLIVTAGSQHRPSIQVYTLEQYVPQLRVIRESDRPNKLKNRNLKRIFTRVYPLLNLKTDLSRTFTELKSNELTPTVAQFHHSITVYHRGYQK